jgi:LPS export ABC transporter protein LptC
MVNDYYSISNFQSLIIVFASIICVSCSNEKTEYVNTPLDNEVIPNMVVDSVTELISDSGIIRYKLITDTWLYFEKARDPYWYFPKGLYIEQFDTSFRAEVTIKADTAWNYRMQRLWKLKGHVHVRNVRNETFDSDELYWDERMGKVYSRVYIEINRPDELTLKGYGFESNQQMTQYKILRPHDSIIFVEEATGDSIN